MHCSKLNAHLKELHVVDSESCACGHNVEDTNHYLLQCPLYVNERNVFMLKLNGIGPFDVNAYNIIHGTLFNEFEDNKAMFEALFVFVEDTNRL